MKKIFLVLFVMLSMIGFSQSYTISEDGKTHIKYYEKCRLTSYRDFDGYYTIGWGHHSKSVKQGETITQKRADELFDLDIKKIEESANRLLRKLPYEYEFSQGFFDGFCSLIYNCGEGSIQKTLFYSKLKQCRVVNGIMNQEDFEYVLSLVKSTRTPTNHHKQRRIVEYHMMRA